MTFLAVNPQHGLHLSATNFGRQKNSASNAESALSLALLAAAFLFGGQIIISSLAGAP